MTIQQVAVVQDGNFEHWKRVTVGENQYQVELHNLGGGERIIHVFGGTGGYITTIEVTEETCEIQAQRDDTNVVFKKAHIRDIIFIIGELVPQVEDFYFV